ncbi:formylglycine-generating enzyme family protein [Roseovarius sp. C7]|uniref:formylglycine-generating enzyme family protein n=1 Tax=Roseovarius sp. C7 TaxID=3398643 RepID=UPI0039F719E2
MKPCCSPSRTGGAQSASAVANFEQRRGGVSLDVVSIPGGTGLIGTDKPYLPQDGEGPMRQKKIPPFRMDAEAVSNARFAEFVAATGYVSEAEMLGDSFVFQGFLPKGFPPTHALADAPWWRVVRGASWRAPTGPESAPPAPDHPVVHVSWTDASAFAQWAGGRLPTEAQWEHAARGGLGDVRFPWGNEEPDDESYHPCNIWQGNFPYQDLALDGYAGTAPVRSFQSNGYGLFNMVGNVWEWTCEPYKLRSLKKTAREQVNARKEFKLSKGGSFLCHRSYCFRYRIAARNGMSRSSSTSHLGFRLVYDLTVPSKTWK